MSETGNEDDKQYEPTQKKLDDARRKGELPRSADLNTASSYAGFILITFAAGGSILAVSGSQLMGFLASPDRMSDVFFRESARPLLSSVLLPVVRSLAPWFLVPGVLVLLSAVAQRSLVFTPEKIRPRISRISIIANAKNKFGRSGLFEFAKSSVKLVIYSLLVFGFLYWRLPEIVSTIHLQPGQGSRLMFRLIAEFMILVFLIAATIGVLDFLWQYGEHIRRNRMSRKDMTDEAKESEGDPHMKQQRRQKAVELAMNKMLAQVPEADVIVVNPEHYAVALKWSREPGAAPVCVAKGVDEIAARIREIAGESGIPLYRDPPLARALHAMVDIGQEILPQHYKAVAAAIRFAERIRRKSGRKVPG